MTFPIATILDSQAGLVLGAPRKVRLMTGSDS